MLTRAMMIAVTLAAASIAAGEVKPLDPNSDEPLPQQIQKATSQPSALTPTTNPQQRREQIAADATAARAKAMDEKFAAVEREVARLRALGEPANARAVALESALRALRERRTNNAVVKDDQPELHVVGVYEGLRPGELEQMTAAATQPQQQVQQQRRRRRENVPLGRGAAVVEVQATGRPIVLAIGAYESVNWDVRVAKEANLQKVIVGGYYDQQVTGLPEGTPVETHTHQGGSPSYFYTYGQASDGNREASTKLRALTGLEASTVQGTYKYAGQPLVVGPGSDEWVQQRILVDLDPLHRRATAWELARRREAVADLRFTAIKFSNDRVARADPAPALAEFTPLGPSDANHRPLPPRTTAVAQDPSDGTLYAIAAQNVLRIDGKTGQQTSITPNDPELPRMTRPGALAFDSKRRRLVVSAGPGFRDTVMYAYDPATEKWTVLIDLEGIDLSGLVYSVKDDCFYGVPGRMMRRPSWLIRYTPDGDATGLILLSQQTSADFGPPDATSQLIPVDDRLVLLPALSVFASMPRPGVPAAKRECYVIDPRTGDVLYAGKFGTSNGPPQKFAPDELEAVWNQLAEPESAEAGVKLLATARQQAVEFIRAELPPAAAAAAAAAAPPDPRHVSALIAELDQEDAARRDAATRELRRLGRQVEPALRDALKSGPSLEATMRLEGLLRHLDPATTAEPKKRDREGWAMQTLARIGTTAAIELLNEYAAGPEDAPRTTEARQALEEFVRDQEPSPDPRR